MALTESEAGLIAQLRDLFHASFQTGVEIGIGDDAAVILASNKKLVATVDMAVEDIHFKRGWSTPFQIGAKLTTANLADIFAMGATPKYLLVAAAITEVNNSQMVSELAKGIRSVADKFEVAVIGGDLSRAEKMSLSITALGEISEKPITRSGAKVGDIVYVSALPGLSAAGLAILTRGLDRPRYVVEAHLNPKLSAPDKLIQVATSMCDISDGLVTDASHIASASTVRINLSKDKLISGSDFKDLAELAVELGEQVFDWILTGGEDHFFLATVDPKNASDEIGLEIGVVELGNGEVLLDGEKIQKAGYQHF
ncbi:MAG: thiamine-phosphate kinase [Candidatus Nanopelagicaceae bacterium]|nr:thiamine-phosphate kinase [Candidatus Nanopelagicaceae bacterium]